MNSDLSSPSGINWSALLDSAKSLLQNPIHPEDPLPALPDGRIPYFAYGSNLDRQRLGERCPGAQCLGPALCPNATVQFRKYITLIPHISRSVPGLVYALTPDDLSALDRFEGYPDLYMRYRVVLSNDLPVFTYIMREGARPIQPPPLWYFNLISTAGRDLPDPDSHLDLLKKAHEAASAACVLPSFLIHGKNLIFAKSAEELWQALFDHRGPFLSHLDAESYFERILSMLGTSPEEARSMSFEEVTSTLANAGILVRIADKGRVSPSISIL
jgi:gamma-glutamylcyclotransferase (GGCT)/AIG2-like uncharacterized protein YtfP